MRSHNSQKGFTLVELSIVIVIIGLIVAGVTGGQALVKQTQIRGILIQADQVRGAVNAFKLQYNGLPGDIINGFSYWSGCTSAAVCNGDGNKQIGTALKTGTQPPEGYIAWWQLNAAGVFPASVTIPASGSGVVVGTLGTNIPASKFSGVGISLGYSSTTMLSSTTGSGGASKNIILFGAAATTLANGVFLTPAQAFSLDSKADDGNALTGSMYGGFTNAGVLGTGLTNAAATAGCANPTAGTTLGAYAVGLPLVTAANGCSVGFAL